MYRDMSGLYILYTYILTFVLYSYQPTYALLHCVTQKHEYNTKIQKENKQFSENLLNKRPY